MPTIRAAQALNLTTVNFTDLFDYAITEFTNNANVTINGIVYEDILQIYDDLGGGQRDSAIFGGAGVTVDAFGNVTGGSATGFYSAVTSGTSIVSLNWSLEGFNYSAVAIAQAAATVSTTDDYQILGSILSGADTFILSNFADTVRGYAGNDIIRGQGGSDILSGDGGNDTIEGGGGHDRINGGIGADTMVGGAGNDTYFVDDVGDRVYETTTTTSGIDAGGVDAVLSTITVSLNSTVGIRFVEKLTLQGANAINGTGNTLANTITGNTNDNILSGLDGNDVMRGGLGADRMVGGNGRDLMYAGVDTSIDTFTFAAIGETGIGALRDVLYEFQSGEDKINLRALDANTSLIGDQNFTFSATGPQANSVWTVVAGANLVVRGDVNGDTTADFEIQVNGLASLVAGDFVL